MNSYTKNGFTVANMRWKTQGRDSVLVCEVSLPDEPVKTVQLTTQEMFYVRDSFWKNQGESPVEDSNKIYQKYCETYHDMIS